MNPDWDSPETILANVRRGDRTFADLRRCDCASCREALRHLTCAICGQWHRTAQSLARCRAHRPRRWADAIRLGEIDTVTGTVALQAGGD